MVGGLTVAYSSGVSELASLGAVVLIMLRSLGYAQSVQASFQDLSLRAPYLETLAAEQAHYVAATPSGGGVAVDHIGTISFDHVSFEYEPDVPVLHDVTFQVPRGEIVGIVGPSGSGKSTLVQLLLRLRDATSGTVRANGRDVRKSRSPAGTTTSPSSHRSPTCSPGRWRTTSGSSGPTSMTVRSRGEAGAHPR